MLEIKKEIGVLDVKATKMDQTPCSPVSTKHNQEAVSSSCPIKKYMSRHLLLDECEEIDMGPLSVMARAILLFHLF